MKRRDETNLEAYHDGALSERRRKRTEHKLESDPELRAHLDRTERLGDLMREAWNEGPPAPAPEYLISMLRPEMARIDAERAAEAAARPSWLERLTGWMNPEWLSPGNAVALTGAAALLLMAILPQGSNQITPEMVAGNLGAATAAAVEVTDWTPNPLVKRVSTASIEAQDTQTPIYDLAQGENPLMVFEAEDATVIWVLGNDALTQAEPAAPLVGIDDLA